MCESICNLGGAVPMLLCTSPERRNEILRIQ